MSFLFCIHLHIVEYIIAYDIVICISLFSHVTFMDKNQIAIGQAFIFNIFRCKDCIHYMKKYSDSSFAIYMPLTEACGYIAPFSVRVIPIFE